jgi:TolA-binding protein
VRRFSAPQAFSLSLAALVALFLLASGTAALAGETEDFQILRKLVQEGAFQTALVQAQSYLAAYPNGPHRSQAAAWGGHLLVENGDAEAALPLLEEARKSLAAKSLGEVPLDQARALLALRRYDESLAALKGYQPSSDGARALYHRTAGEAYSALGQDGEALRSFQAIPVKLRTRADRFHLALSLSCQGEDRAAAGLLESLLSEDGPGLGQEELRQARLALAGSRYRLKDYDGAVGVLAPLLPSSGEGGDAEAALLAAWALKGKGQEAQAYDLFRRFVPLQGWEEAAAAQPLLAAAAARDWDAVIRLAPALLQRFPKGIAAAEGWLSLAAALKDRDDGAGTFHALEEALKALPSGTLAFDAALEAADVAWTMLHNPGSAQRWLALAAQAAVTEEQRAQAALALARLLWAKGESAGALSALAALVKDYPGTPAVPEAYLLLGRMRLAEGDGGQGREALQVVLDSFADSPAYPEALLTLAEALASRGEWEELKGVLGEAEAGALDAASRLRLLRIEAQSAMAQGDWPRGAMLLAEADGARTGPPDERDAYLADLCLLMEGKEQDALVAFLSLQDPALRRAGTLRVAAALASQGKHGKAQALWRELGREGGKVASLALWALAEDQIAGGETDAGLATLRTLAALPPSDPISVLAQRRLEMTLLTAKGPGAALDAVPAFREAQPVPLAQADSLLRTARLAAKAGDPAAAERSYGAYAARFPSAAGVTEAKLFLARRALAFGDDARARKLLEALPSAPERDLLLGEACFRLRDMPAAQSALEAALAFPAGLDQGQALKAELLAGNAAKVQGKTAGAVKHLEAYATQAPADSSNREELLSSALWLQRRGRLESALHALERLRKAFRDAAIGFQYGYTLELMNRPEEALKAYLEVAYTASNPQWALTARYRAAELMLSLGRKEDAVALYRELAARTAGSVQGDFAKKRLEELSGEPPSTSQSVNPEPPKEGPSDAPPAPSH